MNKAVISGLKELLRTILLSVIPVVIVQLSDPNFTLRVIVIAVVISTLKAIDEWLSKEDKGINKQGLTGF